MVIISYFRVIFLHWLIYTDTNHYVCIFPSSHRRLLKTLYLIPERTQVSSIVVILTFFGGKPVILIL